MNIAKFKLKSVADPGFPIGGGGGHRAIEGGADRLFSAKMYAKMKELDPMGGGGTCRQHPLDPPM